MTLKITIKDYPCGYGKTTKTIKNLSSNERYLIVLPTLDEITRVINGSKHVKLLTPELVLDGATTKKEALQTLALAGESIAITHALFWSLKGVVKEGLLSDYSIIIDEVPEVVKSTNYLSRESIQEFYIDTGYITVDNDGLVTPNDKWCSKNKQVSDTLSENIRIQAKKGHLFLAGGSTFLSVLPEILLTSGKSVCILSYKTSGSYLLPYLKKLSIPYLVESDIEAEKKVFKQRRCFDYSKRYTIPIRHKTNLWRTKRRYERTQLLFKNTYSIKKHEVTPPVWCADREHSHYMQKRLLGRGQGQVGCFC